jgi:hypothetical protein
MTDHSLFWSIVQRVRNRDPEVAAEALDAELRGLTTDQVRVYERSFLEEMTRANTWAHHSSAQDVVGAVSGLSFVSDDVFVSLRTWVIYQGKDAFDAWVRDPATLADLGLDSDEQVGLAEELEFLPTAVYEERTGRQLSDELPQELSPYEAPAGTPPS